jgi:hypothetical protein
MTMSEELRSRFTEDELAVLDQTRLADTGPTRNGALRVAASWQHMVDKVSTNRWAPSEDHRTWVAHDFVATLFMRDFLDDVIELLPADLAAKLRDVVAPIDETFTSVTDADDRGLAAMLGSTDSDKSAWWWQRLPQAGLMREEFETLASERLDTDARG